MRVIHVKIGINEYYEHFRNTQSGVRLLYYYIGAYPSVCGVGNNTIFLIFYFK